MTLHPLKLILSLLLWAGLATGQELLNTEGTQLDTPEKKTAFRLATETDKSPTRIWFDDFQKPDTANSTIGPARSGQSYTIDGSGAASARILRGGLDRASPRGTIYVNPQLDFQPERFGTEFSLNANAGGSTSAFFAMIIASEPGGLDPMIHIVWTQTALAVEYWPGPGEAGKTIYLAKTFVTPLRTDGTSYVIEFEFHPSRNEMVVHAPDGSPPVVLSIADLASKMSAYATIEIGGGDTAVWHGRYESAWAWPAAEERQDWMAAARAISASRRQPSVLVDINTGFVDRDYLQPASYPFLGRGYYPIDTAGGQATLIAGSGTGTPARWWRMSTGTTINSGYLYRPTSNVFTKFGRVSQIAGVDFRFPVSVGYGQMMQLPATGKFRLQLGRTTSDATIANLSSAGIGIIIDSGAVTIEAHNGTTRVTQLTTATVGTGAFSADFYLRCAGGVVTLSWNDVVVGTLAGGPTEGTADSAAGLHISVENGATASAATADFAPGAVMVFVEDP